MFGTDVHWGSRPSDEQKGIKGLHETGADGKHDKTHKKNVFFSVKYSLMENSSPDLVYPLNKLTSLPICDLQMKVNSGSDRCGLLPVASRWGGTAHTPNRHHCTDVALQQEREGCILTYKWLTGMCTQSSACKTSRFGKKIQTHMRTHTHRVIQWALGSD